MGYGEVDQLAINTIRILAVSTPVSPTLCDSCSSLPFKAPIAGSAVSLTLSPFKIGRCHLCSKLRPSRSSHGHGAHRPCSLQQIHDLQPQKPELAQSRSFRPFVSSPFLYRFFPSHQLVCTTQIDKLSNTSECTTTAFLVKKLPYSSSVLLTESHFFQKRSRMYATICFAASVWLQGLHGRPESIPGMLQPPQSHAVSELTENHSISVASHLVILKVMIPKVLKSQLAHLDRVSQTQLVLPLLRRTLGLSSTSRAMILSTTTPIASSVTGALWRVLPVKLPVPPVTCN